MCSDHHYFDNITESCGKEILVANNSKLKVNGIGNVKVNVEGRNLTLKNVHYVPEICANLISVLRITESGYQVIFTQGRCRVVDNEENLFEAKLLDGMYRVKLKSACVWFNVNGQRILKRFNMESCNAVETKSTRAGQQNVNSRDMKPTVPVCTTDPRVRWC